MKMAMTYLHGRLSFRELLLSSVCCADCVFGSIDRAAGKKEAAYMKLDKTTVPIMGAGHFSAAMDDESSDDEFSGQI